jgi:hypothetical protein
MSPRALMAAAQVIEAPGASNDQYSQNWRYSEAMGISFAAVVEDLLTANLVEERTHGGGGQLRLGLTHAPDASRSPTGGQPERQRENGVID